MLLFFVVVDRHPPRGRGGGSKLTACLLLLRSYPSSSVGGPRASVSSAVGGGARRRLFGCCAQAAAACCCCGVCIGSAFVPHPAPPPHPPPRHYPALSGVVVVAVVDANDAVLRVLPPAPAATAAADALLLAADPALAAPTPKLLTACRLCAPPAPGLLSGDDDGVPTCFTRYSRGSMVAPAGSARSRLSTAWVEELRSVPSLNDLGRAATCGKRGWLRRARMAIQYRGARETSWVTRLRSSAKKCQISWFEGTHRALPSPSQGRGVGLSMYVRKRAWAKIRSSA